MGQPRRCSGSRRASPCQRSTSTRERALPAQASKYEARLADLSGTVEKSSDLFTSYASRCAECDEKSATLQAEMEPLRAKVNGFDAKRAALKARCEAVASKISEASARREALAAEVRTLQAARAERAAAPAKAVAVG